MAEQAGEAGRRGRTIDAAAATSPAWTMMTSPTAITRPRRSDDFDDVWNFRPRDEIELPALICGADLFDRCVVPRLRSRTFAFGDRRGVAIDGGAR